MKRNGAPFLRNGCAVLAEYANHYRKIQTEKGTSHFTEEQLKRYSDRYDEILKKGWREHKQTKGKYAQKEEKKILNRLKKYKRNHHLFLYNFEPTRHPVTMA